MKIHLITGVVAAILMAFPSAGQQQLTLKACIDYGLRHNRNVKIARISEETAHEQAREALSAYLPQVSGSATLDDNVKLQSTVIPAGIFGSEPTRVALGTKYATNASAQLDQVIYDQALLTGLKANKPNMESALLNAEKTRENLIYNISTYYYQVFITEQQIGLLRDNLDKTRKIAEVLKLQLEHGVIRKVDLDRTQVSLNNIQSQLNLAENNLILAQNRLKFQMGMDLNEQVTLAQPAREPEMLLNTPAFDYNLLTDFKLQKVNMQLYGIEKARIQAGYLPKLSLYARYGTQALGNELGASWNKWMGYGAIGLKMTIPVFDGFRKNAQWKQADLKLQTLNEQLQLNIQNYELQNSNSQMQLKKASSNVISDESNVALAREVYAVTTLQYQQGTVTLPDLLNAETSYKEAQNNYINSLLSYYQARLDLEQSQGTLSSFYIEL